MASIAQAAAHLGITPTYFYRLVVRGVFEKKGRAAYDLDQVMREWRRWRGEPDTGEEDWEGSDLVSAERSFTREKTRWTRLRADAQDLVLAQKRGELVEVAAISRVVEKAFTLLRQQLLVLPREITTEMLAFDDPGEAELFLENRIRELLQRMADDADELVDLIVDDGSDSHSKPSNGDAQNGGSRMAKVSFSAPASYGKRMGRPRKKALV